MHQTSFSLLLGMVLTLPLPARTIVVDRGGTEDFVTIQPAIDAADVGDTVLVQPGEYVVNVPVLLNKAITLASAMGPSVTTIRLAPDAVGWVVVLADHSGELAIEGFTVTGGRSSGFMGGGGVYSGGCCRIVCDVRPCVGARRAPRVVGCVVSGNEGFAVFIDEDSSVACLGSVVSGNTADGIFLCEDSTAHLVNSVVSGNTGFGVLLRDASCFANLTNCTVTGNRGGGIDNVRSPSPLLRNCILWGNEGPVFVSGIEAAPPTVTYSCVEGGWAGEGNILQDPLFVLPGRWDDAGTPADLADDTWVEGDYHLGLGSPCVDAGVDDGVPATDLDGNARPCGDGIDAGAFENDCKDTILFVRGDCNSDGTVDIADAVSTLGVLFLGQGDPGCGDACDSNDDSVVDISDGINTLGVLFLGSGVIPLPGGTACGVDPTADEIGCKTRGVCP